MHVLWAACINGFDGIPRRLGWAWSAYASCLALFMYNPAAVLERPAPEQPSEPGWVGGTPAWAAQC